VGYEVGRYISLERLIEQSKETYYEALQMSSAWWHEEHHRLKPWWEYSLGILIGAFGEFEERVGTITTAHGAETALIEQAYPHVSRDMICVVLNRLREEGKLGCKGTGRSAFWEKRGNNDPQCGNKRGDE
jgi:hypothetical protein